MNDEGCWNSVKAYGSIIFSLFLCASENFHSTKLKRNPHLTHIPFCFYNKLFEMAACTSLCLFFVTSCLFCNQVNLAFSWPLSWNHSFQGHQKKNPSILANLADISIILNSYTHSTELTISALLETLFSVFVSGTLQPPEFLLAFWATS